MTNRIPLKEALFATQAIVISANYLFENMKNKSVRETVKIVHEFHICILRQNLVSIQINYP